MEYIGFDHVQIAIPEGGEDEAREFYNGVLCLPEISKPAVLAKRGGVWFRVGSQELHLGVQTPFFPASKAHPAFLVQSVDRIVHILSYYDVEVLFDAPIPGKKRISTKDPFGNKLEWIEIVSKDV
ncbi:glyoxalase [Bacillaceae bacterium SIJ1]|uniref:glyoxalase n=1 Tax=Litoribacterium kuwaitense TaxID=1398745 RepID=UPI0013EC0C66|nr:glyoxalase [Litoribacterium kuwaitense]NGP46543.1 glyoxalase [Litoribacterium kuwaitense]